MRKKHSPPPPKGTGTPGIKASASGNHEKGSEESTGLAVTIPPEIYPGGAEVGQAPRSVRQSSAAPLCSKRESKEAVSEGIAAGWSIDRYKENRTAEFAYKRPQLHREDPVPVGETTSAAAGQSTNILKDGIPASGDQATDLALIAQATYSSTSDTIALKSKITHLRERQDEAAERLAYARDEEDAARAKLESAIEDATSPEKVAELGARPVASFTAEYIRRLIVVLGISLVETLVFAMAVASLYGINIMNLAYEWRRAPVWVVASFVTAFGWTAVVMVGVHITGHYLKLAFHATSLTRFKGILLGVVFGSSTLAAIGAISFIRKAIAAEGSELVPEWCFFALTVLLPLVAGWLLMGISELRASRQDIYRKRFDWDWRKASLSEPVRHLKAWWKDAVQYRQSIEKEQQRIDQELAKLIKLIEQRENVGRQRIDTEFLLDVAYAHALESTLAVEERLFAGEQKRKENS